MALEIVVVEFDPAIVRSQLHCGLIFFTGFLPEPLFFIGDRKVVMGGHRPGVPGEDLFPPKDRLVPKILFRRPDAEADLILKLSAGASKD